MAESLRPVKGGFLRPFGCGWFIRQDILELATKYGRYGYRRITALLNNEKHWNVNIR